MRFLHGLYKLNLTDTLYRKLKYAMDSICNVFSKSLTFLTPANNQDEVVISTFVLSEQCRLSSNSILRNAVDHLRQNFSNQLPESKWPLTTD